ncbi:MAG TPA: hypothetical protein ACFYEM_09665 [Candidatus Hypogeohydataceae bacterium YC40]
MKNRWLWGFIDYAHGTIERTREVKADRVGNRLILKTPFGGLLWGYERSWGSASILPRRNNVFAGSLAKQPFESGSQDLRDYGYVIDTVRVRRWIMNEEEIFPIKPIDLQGYVLFTDSNAAVGQRPLVDFASEKFTSFQADLNSFVNRGRWFELGFNFLFINYNPTQFGKFTIVDQKETINRDIWRGRVTVPVLEEFHISGLYEQNHDVHNFVNTNIPTAKTITGATLPQFLIPDRSVFNTRQKFGPEFKYFFGNDLHKAASMGLYAYTGDNAGSLAEFGLKRAFRVDSAGQFAPLELHNSFGLSLGYEEYDIRTHPDDYKWQKWGINAEAGYLDSDSVSRPFSGAVAIQPPHFNFFVPATQVRQFDENLHELFFQGHFFYRLDLEGKHNPFAGWLRADFSYWNIEREGKQTLNFPSLKRSRAIPSFRDDRRILQLGTSYELDRPRHHFFGLYSIGLDFNYDVQTSDKVGGITVGFFY